MPINIKEETTFVPSGEVEEEIEPGFYFGLVRPSVGKPDLIVYPILFSDGEQTIEFLVRTSQAAEIGQCTGADLKAYQEDRGVRIDPFSKGVLKDDDDVLVIKLGNTETFLMKPTAMSCYGVQYNSETGELTSAYEGAHKIGDRVYGFTIDLGPDGPVFSGDSDVNPFFY